MKKLNQGGFTIVELLIATSVFSTVMLITTFSIIQISKMYIKGFTESQTQNLAISLTDELSRDIEYSQGSGHITPDSSGTTPLTYNGATYNYYYFCIGQNEYFYQSYYNNLSTNPANPYEFFVITSSCGTMEGATLADSSIPTTNPTNNAINLLSSGMQLMNDNSSSIPNPEQQVSTYFKPNPVISMDPTGSIYKITIDILNGSNGNSIDNNIELSPVSSDEIYGLEVCSSLNLIQPNCATYNTIAYVSPLD